MSLLSSLLSQQAPSTAWQQQQQQQQQGSWRRPAQAVDGVQYSTAGSSNGNGVSSSIGRGASQRVVAYEGLLGESAVSDGMTFIASTVHIVVYCIFDLAESPCMACACTGSIIASPATLAVQGAGSTSPVAHQAMSQTLIVVRASAKQGAS